METELIVSTQRGYVDFALPYREHLQDHTVADR